MKKRVASIRGRCSSCSRHPVDSDFIKSDEHGSSIKRTMVFCILLGQVLKTRHLQEQLMASFAQCCTNCSICKRL